MLSDVLLTVTVAVLMTLPEVLAVGVVPPVVEAVPDPLVVPPHTAKRTTSAAKRRIVYQVRGLAYEAKSVVYIVFASFARSDIHKENELGIVLMKDTFDCYKDF